MSADPRVPVTLLAGFLGSGKTTLLNRMLRRSQRRIAVVVNEFGELPIDGALVVGADDDVIELANGCLCCTVRGDLQEAVAGLLERRRRRFLGKLRFDHLVVEASGLAAPGPVLQTFLVDGVLASQTRVDGVVTMVNGVDIRRQLVDNAEATEQLVYADHIVLNHADRCDGDQLAAAEAAVRQVNPSAPIQVAERAQVDTEALLSLDATKPSFWKPGAWGTTHAHHDIRAVALRSDTPLDLHQLKLWLQFLASNRAWDILRIKGLVRCIDQTRAVMVHAVYQWLELGPGPAEAPEQSAVVVIGRNLDVDALHRGWQVVTVGGRGG